MNKPPNLPDSHRSSSVAVSGWFHVASWNEVQSREDVARGAQAHGLWCLYECPLAAVTDAHTPRGLHQQKCLLPQLWSPEI